MHREVYRDRWLLVVDKPAGLPTQRTREDEAGLFEELQAIHPYVGMHHRLDRPASGLVLFTLDASVNKAVSDALRAHRIERRYLAVLYGSATDGTWSQPVEGRAATSDIHVMGQARGLSAVQIRLQTGRKHQIRVQAALGGAPVVGDRRYGGIAGRRWPRLALHAHRLELAHPRTGERLALVSELPDDLRGLWAEAGGALPETTHPEG